MLSSLSLIMNNSKSSTNFTIVASLQQYILNILKLVKVVQLTYLAVRKIVEESFRRVLAALPEAYNLPEES